MSDTLNLSNTPVPTTEFGLKLFADACWEDAEHGVIREDGKKGKGGLANFSHGRAGDIIRMNPYSVFIRPDWNLRDAEDPANRDHVRRLAESIAEIGLQRPLEVYFDRKDQRAYLVDGHCRLQAVWYANEHLGARIELVSVLTAGMPQSELDRMATAIVSGSGKPPSTHEKARQVRKMVALSGQSLAEIARRIGERAKTVQNWLEAEAAITPQLHKLIVAGRISSTTAMECLDRCGHDADRAQKEIERAIEIAERSGRQRAMPRHVREAHTGQKAMPLKRELALMIAGGDIVAMSDTTSATLSMSRETYERLMTLIGRPVSVPVVDEKEQAA